MWIIQGGKKSSPIRSDAYFLEGRFSTQENKHRIGWDWTFFHLVLFAPPDQKKLKILQLFIIRVADRRFKLEQNIGTEIPCAGSILFRGDPIWCLFSWLESVTQWAVCMGTWCKTHILILPFIFFIDKSLDSITWLMTQCRYWSFGHTYSVTETISSKFLVFNQGVRLNWE